MGGKENVREQNAYSELYIEDAMCNMANLVCVGYTGKHFLFEMYK